LCLDAGKSDPGYYRETLDNIPTLHSAYFGARPLGSKLLSQFVEDFSNTRALKPRPMSALFLQLSLSRSPELARCLAFDARRDLNGV
jgi:hypothetical protein